MQKALRGQINRIKETTDRVLKKTPLSGKEQGVTIVSVLTALGMIIGALVEAVIPTTGGTGRPKPTSKEGVKEWVKSNFTTLLDC